MTKFSSLARARVIGPEGGAWDGGASGGAGEGAAGVDVLVVSSSATKRSRMPPNSTNVPKCQFRVTWAGLHVFVAKNSDATSLHELLHWFGPFCIEFRKATKQSRMHSNSTNAPKCQFLVQWGGSGAFVAKKSDATSWHEILHLFGPFCIEFRKATKWS